MNQWIKIEQGWDLEWKQAGKQSMQKANEEHIKGLLELKHLQKLYKKL